MKPCPVCKEPMSSTEYKGIKYFYCYSCGHSETEKTEEEKDGE